MIPALRVMQVSQVFAKIYLPWFLVWLFGAGAGLPGSVYAQVISDQTSALRAPPPPPDENDPPFDDARMVIQSVPGTMFVNGAYDVSVHMKNMGNKTWTQGAGYKLGAVGPNDWTWGLNRVELPNTVLPGGTTTLNFRVKAPSTPGSYTFRWQMLQEGVGWFGLMTNLVTVTVREPLNNAQYISHFQPTEMQAGQRYDVSVTMLNNGETTWTRALQYTLMSQAPHNNTTWGFNRVPLPVEEVRPGQSVTFTFAVTAPATAGSYVSQWGMQREGHGSFGASTPPLTVAVAAPPPLVNNAQVVGISAPSRMTTGQPYNVAVTMKNSGTTTWTPGANYKLGSQNPHNNQTWGLGRVPVAATVAPGQQYTFNFQVTAPAAGSYAMQWGMLQEEVEWFGAAASSPVTVTENLGNVTFIHTDGLGSPVARTDLSGKVVSRTRYEPYGHVASGAAPTMGFTGHVNDAETGLTYMQQRYYDPVAGRFLSIDPVTTDANTGTSFNRFTYGNNNPYRYIDPDGRDFCGAYQCEKYGSGNSAGRDNSTAPGISTSAKVGAVLGGAAGGLAAAGCDIYSVGACVVANPAIVAGGVAGGAALGAVTGQQLDVAWKQLNRLLDKADNDTTGPLEIQYALVATVGGSYPDVRGGITTLNAGDVWKYGTTVDPNGRYPLGSLKGLNLKMIEQTVGTRYQVLAKEKLMLIQHAIRHGELPPGNRIFK